MPSVSQPELETRNPQLRPRSWWPRLVAIAVWSYFAGLVLLWLWLRVRGDRGPWATVVLFGPRWLCLMPLVALAPLVAIWQRRLWWVLPIALAIGLVPISGLRLNPSSSTAPYSLRVVTCNVGQQMYRPGALAELIRTLDPDIVALQECKLSPLPFIWPEGWTVQKVDELLVASRYPVEQAGLTMRPLIHNKPAAARFLVKLPQGEVQFFNLHLMTPRPGLEAVLDRHSGIDPAGLPELEAVLRERDEESHAISRWVLDHPGPRIVVGDFNMPADSVLFRRDWSSLKNAFTASGFGFGFTKFTDTLGWQYGARIDHLLYSPPWTSVRAWVGPDIGSDHRPLVVDLQQ